MRDNMTYACEDCGFLFYRIGEVKECPSCEKNHIRSATKEETQRLWELLKQGNIILRDEEKTDEKTNFEFFACNSDDIYDDSNGSYCGTTE